MRKLLAFVVMTHLLAIANCQNDMNDIYKQYKFVFNTGDLGDHTREEESDGSGHVTGMYSYLDPNGIIRTVRYDSAPGAGYHAYGDGIPQIGSVLLKTEQQDISLDGLKDSNMIDVELVNRIQGAELNNMMQDVGLINQMQDEERVNNIQDAELVNKIKGAELDNNMQDVELLNKIQGAEQRNKIQGEELVNNIQDAELVNEIQDAELVNNIQDAELVNEIQDAELVNKNYTYEDTNTTTIVPNSKDGIDKEYLQRNESSRESFAVTGDDLTTRSTKRSFSSVVVNHGGIVPFIFPHNPYRQPMNFGPFLYAVPSPFTYNLVAPHYQLLL